ncbi:MAG: UDP-N-acetylmuramate dehydrogenase [Treponemataceae bacterium]|nr:UDP-N-acetylmuramate dehydrogenase [Treponemataceae bacterium]
MNNLCKITENFNIQDCFKGEFSSLSSIIHSDEPLLPRTTFKVGGNARFFAAPKDTEQLILLFRFCAQNSIPFFVLGGGSNLVISDSGIDALVISTENINEISLVPGEKPSIKCGSGATIKKLTEFCIDSSLSGLESFAGLPGTCGGAAYMNARCFNVSFSEKIQSVSYIDENFEERLYQMKESDWDYKKSPFQILIAQKKCLAITQVQLASEKSDAESVRAESEKHVQFREEKGHFKFPSAGSVFKNNHDFGKPSGQIVDECGLRSLKVGGAQVAPWHGNFIINTGDATASDIKKLVQMVQEKVKEKTGFSLECEIIFTDN